MCESCLFTLNKQVFCELIHIIRELFCFVYAKLGKVCRAALFLHIVTFTVMIKTPWPLTTFYF